MKKFRFTLAPVFKVRETQKRQKQMEYAAARDALVRLEEKEANLRKSGDRAADGFREAVAEGAGIDKLSHYTAYFTYLQEEIVRTQREIKRAAQIADKRREELVSLMREVKTLENIRREQYKSYLAEAAKEEDKVLGDIISRNEALGKQE